MAVTVNEPIPVDDWTWLVSGSSDRTPPVALRMYLDGELVDEWTSSDGTFERVVEAAIDRQLEILDHVDAVAEVLPPARVWISWQAPDNGTTLSTVDHYRIEQDTGSGYAEIATIEAEDVAAFNYLSEILDDGADASFRVIAVGPAGNESAALELVRLIVRTPDTPAWDFTWDAGTQRVTLIAA